MSRRNSFSNAATSCTLCSSSKWSSHPRSNSLQSWKRFPYISIKDGLGYTIWSSPDEVIPAALVFWNSQRGIFQLSVALNQDVDSAPVYQHSASNIFFDCGQRQQAVFCFCAASIPRKTYRVFQGAGSRAPPLGEPACKWGWGWAFCRVSSSCCRPFLQAGTGGAPLRAATGYRQGRWCNPPILRPARGEKNTRLW